MATDFDEMLKLVQERAVQRAIAVNADYGPVLGAVGSGIPVSLNDASSSGFYDDTDTYIGYMMAGDLCGDKPLGP